ncbi:aminotransferase class V-fold PLP-dependent enzyme [Pseudomonas kitaguniensis]|uniref:aminotransferase class V-fold PLP-dependent enzyme n=1 Tax=Pseudomonas kitaguniensis TaxID=2607908 RepID=UPI001562E038
MFLVSVSHLPSCCGVINPIEALGALLKGSNALYAVDACQSLGQLPHNLPAKAFVGQARELGLNLWAGTAAHTPLLLKDLGASHFVRASVGRHITLAQVEQALLTLRSV